MLEKANNLKKEIEDLKEFLSYFKIEKSRTKFSLLSITREYSNRYSFFKAISFDSQLKTSTVVIPESMTNTVIDLSNKLLNEKQIEYDNLWRSQAEC